MPIEGVTLRDVLVRTDERGHLAELYSENFGDSLCHVYRCMVRPGGIVKAWHLHLRQTDRFTPIGGVVKVGLWDMRGSVWKLRECQNVPQVLGHTTWSYSGFDGKQRFFDQMWPTDEKWIKEVGDSHTFAQSQTVILDASHPVVLTIPEGVAHGIMALDGVRGEILNAPTQCFTPDRPDELRIPATGLPFDWNPQSR